MDDRTAGRAGRVWRIGELAGATGLTVRALRHFDEIGLFKPGERTPAGHRLYTDADVRRLHLVLTFRDLGTPLNQIANALDGGPEVLESTVRAQLESVDERIARNRALSRRLTALLEAISTMREPAIGQLIDTMEATMHASYLTAEQAATLHERHRESGDEGYARWQRRWSKIAADVTAHIQAGVDPAEPAAQETAKDWTALMRHMTRGDKALLSAIYAGLDGRGAEEASEGVVSAEVWEYVKRTFAVGFRVD